MFKNPLRFVVFAAGLLAIGWIAAGYVTSNLLGLVVTGVIGRGRAGGRDTACDTATPLPRYRTGAPAGRRRAGPRAAPPR